MSHNNLYKGFEVELFTGSLNSHIGVSAEIEKKFRNFVTAFCSVKRRRQKTCRILDFSIQS